MCYPVETQRCILELRVHKMDERSLVALSVNSKTVQCFIEEINL